MIHPLSERQEKVLIGFEKENKNMAQLARELGVSRSQIDWDYGHAKRKRRLEYCSDFLSHLSTRARNRLIRADNPDLNPYTKDDEDCWKNPDCLANMEHPQDIMKLKHIGKKGLINIGETLKMLGYINSVREWINRNAKSHKIIEY